MNQTVLKKNSVHIIDKGNLDLILDLYFNNDVFEDKIKSNFEHFVISIEDYINKIDKTCMNKIVSMTSNEFKISNSVAGMLVSDLKDLETVVPIIGKLEPVRSKKVICEFFKKLNSYLADNNDFDEVRSYLISIVNKVDVKNLVKNVDNVNTSSVVYELLKACLEKLKGQDNKVNVDLIKLIIQKFRWIFMENKVLEYEQFISWIVYLVATEFDLDMLKSLLDCGCIDDCSYFGYSEFETSSKATKNYLDKCTMKNNGRNFTKVFANSKLSKAKFYFAVTEDYSIHVLTLILTGISRNKVNKKILPNLIYSIYILTI